MNEHAGMGCALSGLIVIVFALIFHEKERPIRVTATDPQVSTQPQTPTKSIVPPTSPSVPQVKAEAVRGESEVISASNSPSPKPERSDRVEVVPPAPSVSLVSIKPESRPSMIAPAATKPVATRVDLSPPRPLSARSTITIIAKGERLVDVAVRVYGSAEDTVKLWRANRDRLTSVDDPVSEGWMLRTP